MLLIRSFLLIAFSSLGILLQGQPLRDINYNYLYSTSGSFTFSLKPVRQGDQWRVLYRLQMRDSSMNADGFVVHWEGRQTIGDKEKMTMADFNVDQKASSRSGSSGIVTIPVSGAPNILAAKVIQSEEKRAWVFYTTLEANSPLNDFATVNNETLIKPFVRIGEPLTLSTAGQKVVSYYNDNFPAALPPFTEAQGRVSKGIEPDSTFVISSESFTLPKVGLYLIQTDTSATEGFTLRAEDDYPRFSKLTSLAGPLLYICTRDEITRLNYAKADKRAFDRIILSITNDTERARKLIRNYFRRVEVANQYFTSYKEGWKTDRGMIFIIFGQPDEVFRFNDREVWNYNNDDKKVTFNFAKSSSLFDPDNYVLIRDGKFRELWLETVDLWRSARF